MWAQLSDGSGALARLAIALAGGAMLALALERVVRPGAPGLRRSAASALIGAGSHWLFAAVVLLVFQRALFAAAAALAGQLLVTLVSNAKYRALREPFVFTDFALFSQAFRHPRLYLPFLGVGRAVLAAGAFAGSIYLGLTIEPRLPGSKGIAVAVFVFAVAVLIGGIRYAGRMSFEPSTDIGRVGLVSSLWLYWLAERRAATVQLETPWSAVRCGGDPLSKEDLPDLVAVESESFFDVRRLYPGVAADVLQHFDEVGRMAARRGRLQVAAWGANTMRTEFAFLTGIGPEALGVHRFNPYRLAARRPIPSLPAYLRSLGYRTVCIHPHPASFFERHRVFPNLGFDEFIDLSAFGGAPRAGPYVADEAVTGKIAQVLDQARGPVFIFAITMENHGPLHLERASAADADRLYAQPPPPGFDDLTVYLRHLANADRMLGELAAMLCARSREGVLCWFGDHVPSMPDVYDALGFADGRTDYLIVSRGASGRDEDLPVERLGARLAEAIRAPRPAGVSNGPKPRGNENDGPDGR